MRYDKRQRQVAEAAAEWTTHTWIWATVHTHRLRAKKILPAGALLWAWEADADYEEAAGEQWLILLPEKWNKQVQYAWRYDPCELAPAGRPKPAPRGPRVERDGAEEEYVLRSDGRRDVIFWHFGMSCTVSCACMGGATVRMRLATIRATRRYAWRRLGSMLGPDQKIVYADDKLLLLSRTFILSLWLLSSSGIEHHEKGIHWPV